jgi:distribution and morphology protein 31
MALKSLFNKTFSIQQRHYASISPKKKAIFCRSLAPSMLAYNVDGACFHQVVATNVSGATTATTTTTSTSLYGAQSSATTLPTPSVLTIQTLWRTMLEIDTTTGFHSFYASFRRHVKQHFIKQQQRQYGGTFRYYSQHTQRRRPPLSRPVSTPCRFIHTSPKHTQPHLPHPPSKAELLAQTRTFLERLKVRIKWPLMRQMRPWTLNDVTALFSWLFLGHTVWLLVGTTSFVSLILWFANSLQFQGKN